LGSGDRRGVGEEPELLRRIWGGARPGSTEVLEGAKHPQTKVKAPSD